MTGRSADSRRFFLLSLSFELKRCKKSQGKLVLPWVVFENYGYEREEHGSY